MAAAEHIAAGGYRPASVQHEQMIGLIDELRLMILSRGDSDIIEDTFDELDEVAASEFAREEVQMRAAQVPGRGAHERRHAELARNLRTLRRRFAAEPDRPRRDELYDFLSDLLVHTLCED